MKNYCEVRAYHYKMICIYEGKFILFYLNLYKFLTNLILINFRFFLNKKNWFDKIFKFISGEKKTDFEPNYVLELLLILKLLFFKRLKSNLKVKNPIKIQLLLVLYP